jgi:hypothetical protein
MGDGRGQRSSVNEETPAAASSTGAELIAPVGVSASATRSIDRKRTRTTESTRREIDHAAGTTAAARPLTIYIRGVCAACIYGICADQGNGIGYEQYDAPTTATVAACVACTTSSTSQQASRIEGGGMSRNTATVSIIAWVALNPVSAAGSTGPRVTTSSPTGIHIQAATTRMANRPTRQLMPRRYTGKAFSLRSS